MHFESSLSPRPHDVSLARVRMKKKKKKKRNQNMSKNLKGGIKGFVAGWGSSKLLRQIPSLSSSSCPRRLSL